jgi:hypothetical protein
MCNHIFTWQDFFSAQTSKRLLALLTRVTFGALFMPTSNPAKSSPTTRRAVREVERGKQAPRFCLFECDVGQCPKWHTPFRAIAGKRPPVPLPAVALLRGEPFQGSAYRSVDRLPEITERGVNRRSVARTNSNELN